MVYQDFLATLYLCISGTSQGVLFLLHASLLHIPLTSIFLGCFSAGAFFWDRSFGTVLCFGTVVSSYNRRISTCTAVEQITHSIAS